MKAKTKKKVYIVGPMSFYPRYNHSLFMAVLREWLRFDYDAKTPFELNNIVWRKHFGRDFDPSIDTCDYGDPILAEMFAEDMRYLSECDIVAAIPGWEFSKGSRVELQAAINLNKDIRDALSFAPLNIVVDVKMAEDDSPYLLS